MVEFLSADQKKKLMINYLPSSVDKDDLQIIFEQYGDVANVHIVKNTATNESKGYGFVTYEDSESSQRAIDALNGKQIEDKRLRVAYSTPIDDHNRPKPGGPVSSNDVNVYIANIPKHWADAELTEKFGTFGPVKQCKILKDGSGASRGAGFVRYENSKMAAAAILEMDDKCPEGGSLPLIVKIADGKNKERTTSTSNMHSGVPGLVLNHSAATVNALNAPSHGHGNVHNPDHRYNPYSKPHVSNSINTYNHPGAYPPISASNSHMLSNNNMPKQSTPTIQGYQPPQNQTHQPPHSHPMMPSLSTPVPPSTGKGNYFCIYIGNLPETTCKNCLLYQLFSPYGAIANVKPMTSTKTDASTDFWFGFVNFKNYAEAAQAIQALNGSTLNGRSLKVGFKTEKRN